MALITLTTDFGMQDWFVGVMKGVILQIEPKAQIIDITHEIPAGDVQAGAFALAAAYSFFPAGAIHLAVVDPGVGSKRAAIGVATDNYFFVGPDNGLLSLALARERVQRIHRLDNKKFFLDEVSQTFHGRDIFAPVTAHLSKGVPLGKMGPRLRDYQRLVLPSPIEEPVRVTGAVVYIDHFGNALTNLPKDLLVLTKGKRLKVRIAGRKAALPVCNCYEAVRPGKPLAVIGSLGCLEIAVNGGNAANALRLQVGDAVILEVE